MKKMFFATALLVTTLAQASLLTFEQGSKQLENVNLSPSASINDQNGQPTALKIELLGAGVRSKTVLSISRPIIYIFSVRVYSDFKT